MSQARAYIHISHYSLSRYLEEYPSKARYLLDEHWKGGKHDRSVFATWEISFKAIQEKNPQAAKLLSVCGFLHHDDIPEELLRRGLNLEQHCMNMFRVILKALLILLVFIGHSLEESMRTLFSYSLVKRGSNGDSFSIHPLVHAWARLRLESRPQEEIEIAKEAFGRIISGVHMSKELCTADWIFEQQAMPHIEAVMKQTAQHVAKGNLKTQIGGDSLGIFYQRHGRYYEAMQWYKRELAEEEKALGVDHPTTLTTVHNMASIFNLQGQYAKALEWYERALAGREKALGVDHPDTLATVDNMALVFYYQGQYDKSLEWYKRALTGEEKELQGYSSSPTIVSNMALVFSNQGQYDKALGLCRRVLAGEEKLFGIDHTRTLATVTNMIPVLAKQGQYDKALELCRLVLAGEEKVLGVDHPKTLTIIANIAALFGNQGQYDKALELYRRVLAGEEKALGVDHPTTLMTVHNMAFMFDDQGQYAEALEWYERALAGREKALGVDHPDTIATVQNMAWIFHNQGQHDKALEWYGRALAARDKTRGIYHPETLLTIFRMVAIFLDQGQYVTALEWLCQIYARREALGVESPSRLVMSNMASLFYESGYYAIARVLHRLSFFSLVCLVCLVCLVFFICCFYVLRETDSLVRHLYTP